MHLSHRLIRLAVFFSLSAISARAQTSQVGTVAGQITDEQNAAVPGAVVRMIDVSDKRRSLDDEQRRRPLCV